jgi:hypothetical protein
MSNYANRSKPYAGPNPNKGANDSQRKRGASHANISIRPNSKASIPSNNAKANFDITGKNQVAAL